MDFGSLNTMVKSADGTRYSRSGYNGNSRFWEPESNLPCNQPPWGRLFAINVNTGDIAWQTTLGITDSLPADKQNTGTAEHRRIGRDGGRLGVHRRHRR